MSCRVTCVLLSIVILGEVTSCNRNRETPAETAATPTPDRVREAAAEKPRAVPDIIAAVQQRIASDTRIKSKQVQISFDNGSVQLTGVVTKEDELIFVGLDALEVPGVDGVANYLIYPEKFHDSSAHILTEDEIRAAITAVQRSVRSDAKIKGPIQVSFERFSSAIRLTGKVETEDERVALENAASKVTEVSVSTTVACVCADQRITFDDAPVANAPASNLVTPEDPAGGFPFTGTTRTAG